MQTIYICMVGPYREERPFAAFSDWEVARAWILNRNMIPQPRYENAFVASPTNQDRYVEAYIEECPLD